MDSAIPTRNKIKEIREAICQKSKQINLFTETGVESIPISSEWEPFKNVMIKSILEDFGDDTVLMTKASKGTILERHHHTSNEIMYVLSGCVLENCMSKIYLKGDNVSIESGVDHEFEFLEDSIVLVHWIN